MPRTAAQPIDPKLPAHIRAAFEKIDRDADTWFLPNWRVSILGDAKIYVDNPRIRDSALNAIGGLSTRDHKSVREFLRNKMAGAWRTRQGCRRLPPLCLDADW